MARMQDVLKSFKDLQKKDTPPPPPPPPPPPTDSGNDFVGFSGLDAIKKAIQETLTKPVDSEQPPAPSPPPSAPLFTPPTFPGTSQKADATKSPAESVAVIKSKQETLAKPGSPEQPPEPFQLLTAKLFTPPTTPGTSQNADINERPAESVTEIQSKDETYAGQLYMDLHREIGQVIQDIKDKKPISPKPLEKYIPSIYESVTTSEFLFLKTIQRKRFATWIVSHSVNVAVFSIKIGIGLRYDRDKLLRLGLAALLHDVGMTKIPNSIIFKHGKLTPNEFNIIKEHPIHGYELVKHLKDTHPYITEVVLQEQEREDGSGYPQNLTGDKVNEMAKIVGLADVFEALVHGRAYREGLITYNAIQKIIDQRSKQFNPKVIRALINGVSMFPIGSLVKLSTEEIARVISVNSLRPVRPIVEVIADAEGNKLKTPLRLNLEEEPLIYILKPLAEQ